MSCIFCQIAQKEIPSQILYQDEIVTVFKDLNPQANFHALIIPNVHLDSAAKLTSTDTWIAHLFEVVAKNAETWGLIDGYRLVSNVGKHAGQSVKHLHFHILGGQELTLTMA
jgi:histidine triad (HIT) family protein